MPSTPEHGTRRRRRRRQRKRKRENSVWKWLQRALWPRPKTSRLPHTVTTRERVQAVSWVVALIAVFVLTLSVIFLNNAEDHNQMEPEAPEAAPE
jgi:hypothetical protein